MKGTSTTTASSKCGERCLAFILLVILALSSRAPVTGSSAFEVDQPEETLTSARNYSAIVHSKIMPVSSGLDREERSHSSHENTLDERSESNSKAKRNREEAESDDDDYQRIPADEEDQVIRPGMEASEESVGIGDRYVKENSLDAESHEKNLLSEDIFKPEDVSGDGAPESEPSTVVERLEERETVKTGKGSLMVEVDGSESDKGANHDREDAKWEGVGNHFENDGPAGSYPMEPMDPEDPDDDSDEGESALEATGIAEKSQGPDHDSKAVGYVKGEVSDYGRTVVNHAKNEDVPEKEGGKKGEQESTQEDAYGVLGDGSVDNTEDEAVHLFNSDVANDGGDKGGRKERTEEHDGNPEDDENISNDGIMEENSTTKENPVNEKVSPEKEAISSEKIAVPEESNHEDVPPVSSKDEESSKEATEDEYLGVLHEGGHQSISDSHAGLTIGSKNSTGDEAVGATDTDDLEVYEKNNKMNSDTWEKEEDISDPLMKERTRKEVDVAVDVVASGSAGTESSVKEGEDNGEEVNTENGNVGAEVRDKEDREMEANRIDDGTNSTIKGGVGQGTSSCGNEYKNADGSCDHPESKQPTQSSEDPSEVLLFDTESENDEQFVNDNASVEGSTPTGSEVNFQMPASFMSKEKETATLAFIFDTTGSMYDDLMQARDGAKALLQAFLDHDVVPVSNYILVPFNDPIVEPITVTEDPEEFVKALDHLDIHGGGDCPEMSCTGILTAIQNAHPNSFLYVFSDAPSKDYHAYNDVLDAVQRKHSQVNFFLSGLCRGKEIDPQAYNVYDRIASASGGQVFLMTKEDIKAAMDFVQSTLHARSATVYSVNRPLPLIGKPYTEDFNVTVERDLEKLTVILTGNLPSVDVISPSGESPKTLQTVLDLPNAVVVNVNDPKPAGTWNVNITIQPKDPDQIGSKTIPDGFTLVARGTGSAYQIRHGFSLQPAESLSETAKRPLEGKENYLMVEIHPFDEKPGSIEWLKEYNWTTVDFLKRDGGMLWSLPMKQITNKEEFEGFKFLAGPFLPGDDLFTLSFNGMDGDGNPVTRISANAISPQPAAPPLVFMRSQQNGYAGKNLTIHCQVESLLPFSMDWLKDGQLYQEGLSYEQSSDAYLFIGDLSKEDKGNYNCNATNRRGSAVSSHGTTINVIGPPIISEKFIPTAVITENSSIILDCEVKSDVNYSVTWTRESEGKILDLTSPHINNKFQQLKNNSLLISFIKNNDSGLYICRATNEAGRTTMATELLVVSPPKIMTYPEDKFHFSDGENIEIECRVIGGTIANISWEFNEAPVETFSKSTSKFSEIISIPDANNQWAGKYVCIAINEAGKANKEVKAVHFEPPLTTSATSPHMALKEGQEALMICSVKGRPKPSVMWFYEDQLIKNSDKHQISSDGLSLKVYNISAEDEGTYKCEAHGIQETKSSTHFEVCLGIPPKPSLVPNDTSLKVGDEGWFPCSAENETDVNMFPEMAIKSSWKRENGVPLDLVRHEVLDSGTLHIIDADISDEGIYICTLENVFGKVEVEMELQLTGFMPPLIIGMPEPKLRIPVTNSVLLDCTVISDSEYEVQWIHHHDGIHQAVPIWQDSRMEKLENKSLLISDLTENDSGTYECQASNRAGEASKLVEVAVILPPNLSISPESEFEFFKGENISINCTVEGDTVANISWEFKGIPLNQLSKSQSALTISVTIPYADEEWGGMYTCVAVNEAGKVQKGVLGVYFTPPEVIPENQYVAVKSGEIAEMSCLVNGTPPPQVTWYHNGHVLTNNPKYEISSDETSLKIFNSENKDEGTYHCVAESLKNTKSNSSIHLIIGKPPQPKLPFPFASLKLGEEGLFPCEEEGEPEINLYPGMEIRATWTRKNKPLDPIRHKVLQSGALLISNGETSDEGVYVCVLENDYGKVDLEMDLEIIGLVPPVIVPVDDEDISYLDNENVILWCNASGLPNPVVSWFYKGEGMLHWERLGEQYYDIKNISVSEEKLSIFNANYDNQGIYSCTAENEAGFAEKLFYLNMKAPPVLMDNEGPVDISLVEGESFSLQCTAEGIPDPMVKWLKDGMELPRVSYDGSYRIVDGGLGLEILTAKTGRSDGYYTCSAENIAGKVQKSFKVKVLVPPAHGNNFFVRHVASLQVKLGDPLTIACPIATGVAVPAPTYGWSKDGKMLHTEQVITSENGRSLGHLWISENGKTLNINGVLLDDAGNYSCVGFNKAGRVISPVAEVDVSVPPVHYPDSENSSSYEVIEGENITFNCSVMGIPKPKVVWTKDGNYLSENHPEMKYLYSTKEKNMILAQLTIVNVKGYHSGLYKCLSNNHVGKSSSLFMLNVLIPPYVLGVQDNILEIGEGGTVVLKCSILGNPQPTLSWHKLNGGKNEKLRESRIPNPSALEISDIHKEESGVYICSGTNSIGSTKMSFNVSVLVAPALDGTAPVVRVVAIGENITLKCSPSGSPTPSLSWFKNGYLVGNSFNQEREIHSGNSIFISKDGRDVLLRNVSKDDDGNYTCISYNKAGRIEKTFNVETVAHPLILDWNMPDVVKVLNGSSVSFDCSATGKPTPKVQWTRISPSDNLNTIHKTQNQSLVDSRGVVTSTVQLTFESIRVQDSAVFICKAENKAGTAAKRFHLDVHVPPFVEGHAGDENGENNRIGLVKKQPGFLIVQVVAGQTFTLSCQIMSGHPTPHLMWLRNGKKILKNTHQSQNPYRYVVDDNNSITSHGVYLIDSDETLVISNITEDDSGPYKCVASNEAGTSEVNFNVEVFVPPSLEEGSKVETEFSVKVHSFIALVCPVTGKPMPTIKWFKDSEEIVEEYANMFQISQDKQRLIIMQAKVENTGEYTCVATNEAGTRKVNYKVSVLDEESEWSPWSSWSACSSSCGPGTRKRYRECTLVQPNLKQLVPSHYQKSDNQVDLPRHTSCPGSNVQIQKCLYETCQKSEPEPSQPRNNKKKVKRVPKRASLNLQGQLNGQLLSPSLAAASYDPWSNGPTLEAEIDVDPYQQGNLHPYLPLILSPLTWSTAGEVEDASNGYSLTDGVFEQRSQLEFMSGETLYLSHKGQGVDSHTGELKVTIEVEGEVPQYQSDSMIYLEPYTENYVQTSPSSLYAWSENDLNVNGQKVPYKWNSSLHYDSSLGTMSYLAEQLSLEDLNTYNDYSNHKIVYKASPKISKKYHTNRCPDGFNSDEENLHCIDVDECTDGLNECHETQRCKNEMGSYQCICPQGFTSKAVGHPCIDINECISGKKPCSHECHNNQGSYYCTCPNGMEIKSDKHTCERQGSSPSEKTKLPMLDLLPEYHIIPIVRVKPPAQFWSSQYKNSKGMGNNGSGEHERGPKWLDHEEDKKCPTGYEFISGKCQDIDECTDIHRTHKIRHSSHKSSPCPLPSQQCINTNGSYHCVEMSCPIGYNEVQVDVSARKESLIYCLQLCDSNGHPCQEKAEIAQIIINSIITTSGLRPRRALAQFSVPITAKSVFNETKTLASTTRTTFHKLEDESGTVSRQLLQLFRVRSEGTDGMLYSMKEFSVPGVYRVTVMAHTYNGYSHQVLYATKFVVNVYVTGQ